MQSRIKCGQISHEASAEKNAATAAPETSQFSDDVASGWRGLHVSGERAGPDCLGSCDPIGTSGRSVMFDHVIAAATYPDVRHYHGDRDTLGLPVHWISYSHPTDCMRQAASGWFR